MSNNAGSVKRFITFEKYPDIIPLSKNGLINLGFKDAMPGNPLPAGFSKARLKRRGSRAFYRQTGNMMQPTKIVVRYADGPILKGEHGRFFANQTLLFHPSE